MEEDGEEFGYGSSSEGKSEDDDSSGDHSDSKTVIKPAVKIKLVKSERFLFYVPGIYEELSFFGN